NQPETKSDSKAAGAGAETGVASRCHAGLLGQTAARPALLCSSRHFRRQPALSGRHGSRPGPLWISWQPREVRRSDIAGRNGDDTIAFREPPGSGGGGLRQFESLSTIARTHTVESRHSSRTMGVVFQPLVWCLRNNYTFAAMDFGRRLGARCFRTGTRAYPEVDLRRASNNASALRIHTLPRASPQANLSATNV